MAQMDNLKMELAKKKDAGVGTAGNTIKNLLDNDSIKKRFEEVLKEKAPQYMSSIVNLVNGDTNLKKVDQMSVIASAMVSATLDLPIDKNLGYAWIVPYGNRAQFQLGYKGYVQLALRTGQYVKMNVLEIHEGELIKWDPLTEEIIIDFDKKKSDAVIGYSAYFELINGFKKTTYWTKAEIIKHREKFSKSGSVWKTDFDAMAKKTVLRNLLSKWGILSVQMQKAQIGDEGVVNDRIMTDSVEVESDPLGSYIDAEYFVDGETGEVVNNGDI